MKPVGIEPRTSLFRVQHITITPTLSLQCNVMTNRHFQLNPILILEFEIGVRIFVLRDIIKDNI